MDVVLYKKVIALSNMYFNDGLEKAKVRDLSGAIVSLHQCLKLNKNHIEARNLLGLIYYETGEAVIALKEWVISKNLCANKNIADEYIAFVQNNANRLDGINQTSKKFNQALKFCKQGSVDLAVIQLKKVLSINPKILQAHQLLALLYIEREELDKANRELERCYKIDTGNTITLRYRKELDDLLALIETGKAPNVKKNTASDVIKYQSGNETIIQPINVKEPKVFSSIFNILCGVVIGLLVAWFLILPAQVQEEKAGLDEDLKAVSEQLDLKNTRVTELEQEVAVLTSELENMNIQLDEYVGTDGTLQSMENLILATTIYLAEPTNIEEITGYLDLIIMENIPEEMSSIFVNLYELLIGQVGPTISTNYYNLGSQAYSSEEYEDAIMYLTKSYEYDATNGEALYSLAHSYRKNGDNEKAIELYEQVIALFPGSLKATNAQNYLSELESQE